MHVRAQHTSTSFPLRLRHLEASTRSPCVRACPGRWATPVQHASDHAPRAGRRPSMPPQHNGLLSLREQAPHRPVRCLEHQELNVETTWRVVRSRRAWVAAQAHTAHVRVHPRSSFPRLRTINGKHMSRGWASRTASQRPPPHHKGACISTNSPTHRLPRWL